MADVQLSLCFSPNDRVQPLLDGRVRPQGIDLTVTTSSPGDIFWRQLHHAEFDVSEMSLSSLLVLAAKGDSPWLGLPVFGLRRFFHTDVLVRADAGIERPEDLKGKRVGVPEYQQTGALWVRAALEHEFGVRAQDMDWHMERTETMSHAGATGFRPPPGVSFQYMPESTSISRLMLSGDLDATIFFVPFASSVDRTHADIRKDPRIRTLFRDPRAEAIRYFRKTGIFPINHCVIVRRSIAERYPWVPLNLYRAFLEAKEHVLARTRALAEPFITLGYLPSDAREGLANDPYPYGIDANRPLLESLAGYSHEQGLTPRKITLADVFAPTTLET